MSMVKHRMEPTSLYHLTLKSVYGPDKRPTLLTYLMSKLNFIRIGTIAKLIKPVHKIFFIIENYYSFFV